MPDSIEEKDITLDDVLQTGEDSNRQDTTPPAAPNSDDEGKDKKPATPKEGEGNDEGKEDDASLTPEQIKAIEEENSNSIKTLLASFTDESTLSEEDKAIRSNLLAKYKGTEFDAEGNILDKEGNVVGKFEDILEYTLKEDELKLDEEGNQIDEEGNVVKTKLELAIENTVVNKLHDQSDYQFLDDKGNVKIYSDDEEGIKEFTNDVSAQRFEEWKSEFFNQTPELAEITKHILSGGSIDTYNSAVDYSKLDTEKMSKDEKLKYIRRSFEVSGLSEERVNGLVQLITDSNTVDAEITKALTELQAHEERTKEARNEAYQAAIDKRNKEVEEYWGEVEQVVTKGQLNDINIPDNEKEAFFDYLSTAVDDKGNSKEMLDSKKETLEQRLQIKYLRFKGYDLSQLVSEKAKTQKVLSLREQMRKSAKIKSTPINDANKSKTSREADITIDSLLS